jgi:hypothetical protein
LIDLGGSGVGTAIRMVGHAVDEADAGMLNRIVSVKQFGTDDADL